MSGRCPWCEGDADYIRYHDEEWGVPSHDDRHLFEMLVLEGAQAGLSWLTILRKRAHYRRVFYNFDAARVARFTEEEIAAALLDPGIVRNRLKVRATVLNAQGTLAIREEFGSFDAYLWRFVNGKPIPGKSRTTSDGATRTAESDALSKDMLRRGFKFVGTTICHAYMQAVGLRNDHLVSCPRWRELKG